MINRSEAHQRLLRLNQEHEADRDGAYALVEAIRRAEGALEALVQSGDRDQVVALGPEIASSIRSADWNDNVVLGLLRLGRCQEFLLRSTAPAPDSAYHPAAPVPLVRPTTARRTSSKAAKTAPRRCVPDIRPVPHAAFRS